MQEFLERLDYRPLAKVGRIKRGSMTISLTSVGEAKIGFKIAAPNTENFHPRDIRFPDRSRPIELP
jgi:hypothetical protein